MCWIVGASLADKVCAVSLLRSRYEHTFLQRRAEGVVVGTAKPKVQMPSPAFGVFEDARDAANFSVEASHGIEIRIETLAFVEPELLAGVFGQHLFLLVDEVGRIDDEHRLDEIAEWVAVRIGLRVIDGYRVVDRGPRRFPRWTSSTPRTASSPTRW